MRTASELQFGEKVTISYVDENHPSSRRILEVGFTPGQEIELMNKSIFNDPLAFSIRGTLIAIRKNEADCIKVA
jgi:ferrous iron transport protein A